MHRHQQSTNPLRLMLLTVGGALVLVLGLPAVGSFAAWGDAIPVGGMVATGSLGIDQETLGAGTWTEDGAAFDSGTDRLAAGATLTYTVTDVPVTAVGNNLEATFQDVGGAVVPAVVADHVTLSVAPDQAPITGSDSGADGRQTVDLALTVAADAGLPAGEEIIDLSGLTVTLTNGRGWSDVARLDAGTVTTAAPAAPGGAVQLSYDLAYDDDGVVGFYLDDPLPGTMISWSLWGSDGQEVVTEAVDGLNSMDYSGSGATPYIEIEGGFRGFGSSEQTRDLVGALLYVEGLDDDIGMTSARYAFKDAVQLTGLSGLPSTLTDTSYAFQNAGSESPQSNIQLWGWDSSEVTTMAHMFDGATTFRQPDLAWDTSKVRDMSYMFAGATSFVGALHFTSTSNVTTMEGMFEGATSYVDATWEAGAVIRQWDVSGVTNMASMFAGATSFNVDLAPWDVSSVSTMHAMFQGATSYSQDLSGWDVVNVGDHDQFSDGSGLTADQLPVWNDAQVATLSQSTEDMTTDDGTASGDGSKTDDTTSDVTTSDDGSTTDGGTTSDVTTSDDGSKTDDTTSDDGTSDPAG